MKKEKLFKSLVIMWFVGFFMGSFIGCHLMNYCGVPALKFWFIWFLGGLAVLQWIGYFLGRTEKGRSDDIY